VIRACWIVAREEQPKTIRVAKKQLNRLALQILAELELWDVILTLRAAPGTPMGNKE